MLNLLEELYKTDVVVNKYVERKVFIDEGSYQINGISQSGKTKLVKNYLLGSKKSSYLYIDCDDIRIVERELNEVLAHFCIDKKIDILVLDNYTQQINFVNVTQLIVTCKQHYKIEILKTIQLYPLDYEEFLAYEHKYDSTALNHFFQLGGFPNMHRVNADERNLYLQATLKHALDDMEFDIMKLCAKLNSQKLSAFTIYERLKQRRKVSKDKLYLSYNNLITNNYIHAMGKFNHLRGVKKIYLCDISLKSALTLDKHFGRLFENMIFLELLKSHVECFYDDGIDFYIPKSHSIILGMPFGDERTLFKKLEAIEAFIFTHEIKKITAVTMSKEGSVGHPFSKVEMLPFDIWALGD